MKKLFAKISRNLISFIGLLSALISGVLILTILAIDIFGFHINPYIGVLVYLVLPTFLALGLILIPLGIALEKRRVHLQKGLPKEQALPKLEIDLNNPSLRRRMAWFAAITAIVLSVMSTVTYKAVEFMDSVTFCGQICHEVMKPEYTTYSRSPHSRVHCVSCHIGPGAPWFVKSKLSGAGQVFAVLFNTYDKPIPTPVKNLRPAQETCEQCHWPQKFHGQQLKVITKFSEDEKNTPLKTVLLLKTGGGDKASGIAEGIHWHMNIANEITYIAIDVQRQNIPWVRLKDLRGNITEYFAPQDSLTLEQVLRHPSHRMDCMDCHNRPTHIYRLPEEAVDEALLADKINHKLPFIKKISVELLRQTYSNNLEALEKIEKGLIQYYQTNYSYIYVAKEEDILKAAQVLKQIYSSNIFPEMKIAWGTYTNNIGHQNTLGCFRCHDNNHQSKDGKVIKQDCDQCHNLLAFEEESPKPVIEALPMR